MSRLDKAIRSKRFNVKEGKSVSLIFDSMSGEQFNSDVRDCSNSGIRVNIKRDQNAEEWLTTGAIIPSSKLVFSKNEVVLGRLVIRRVDLKESEIEIAFSLVDSKVPVSGPLSHFLEVDFSKTDIVNQVELSSDKFSLAHFVENEYSNVDLFDRCRQFSVFQAEWEKSKKYGYKTVREASKGPRVNLSRVRKNGRKDYIVMGSNDYLGLGAHPEVVDAAKRAMDLYGFGSTGSAMSTGVTDLHIQLSERIASIHQKESALLFNSGYAANIGIISGLMTTNDLIVADQLCHASIQDGIQMCKATPRYFKHNNIEHLEAILLKERENYNGCLVITEGVFSMDGDVAKLDEIYRVARKYNARIMVDQAHDFGVIGTSGLGVCDKYHLLKDIDIIMGTFSKICGGIGGFVTGSKDLIEWLRHFGRAQIFSVSIPPSTAAAALKALDLFLLDRSLLDKLHQNINHFVKGLESIGYKLERAQESAVIPVIVGDEAKLGEMYQSLLDDGVFVVPVVYPAVSRTNSRFRFTIMATHSLSDLDYVIACLEKAMIKSKFSFSDVKDKKVA